MVLKGVRQADLKESELVTGAATSRREPVGRTTHLKASFGRNCYMEKKKILLLYTDRYYLIKQVYPFGLDLIADYLRRWGHQVTIDYPFLPYTDLEINLKNLLEQTLPNAIGLGIRNLDTCMSCEQYGDYSGDGYSTFYFLPDVKKIVELIRKYAPEEPIIA